MSDAKTEKLLKDQVTSIYEQFPTLPDDDLFLLWCMRALFTDSDQQAADSLSGQKNDKNIDAVLVDQITRTVVIAQGKYRKNINGKTEKRNDVMSFAAVASGLVGSASAFADLCAGMAPAVHQRMINARAQVRTHNYRLHLVYLTTGKCSEQVARAARSLVRQTKENASLEIITGTRIARILRDYLDGAAPPVHEVALEVDSGGSHSEGIFCRQDSKLGISCYLFSMSAKAIGDLINQAGVRIFARNVRGFLGDNEINRGMEFTLKGEPEFFWYFNNGITIICDDAEEIARYGNRVLQVTNPQIINGQQTSRILAKHKSAGASVLVKVISMPRDEDSRQFDKMTTSIVRATNWQNAIKPSDLMSNDRRQIEIERHLRQLQYAYIRKRQTKSEARRSVAFKPIKFIDKTEFAQASAGSDLDPAVVREGKDGLFREQYYDRVFPSSDPYFYLGRYWTLRQVNHVARGRSERAFTKWLVLNAAWSHLKPIFAGKLVIDHFRKLCERNEVSLKDPEIKSLRACIAPIFDSAYAFYKREAGVGNARIELVTFFKGRFGLHSKFASFWKSAANSNRRARFNKNRNQFARRFKQSLAA